MEDNDMLTAMFQWWEEALARENDSDYDVNPAQMNKFVDVVELFMRLTEDCGGRMDRVEISPREQVGGATAYFPFLSWTGDDLAEFCRAMGEASAVSVDQMIYGDICVSVNIPDVYVKTAS